LIRGEVAEWLNAPHSKCGFGWLATRSSKGRRVSPEAPKEHRETGVWYVYFLKLKDGDIYVGSTNNLRRRFNSHQSGDVASTRRYLPAVLSSYVAVEDEATARKLEIYFKSGSGKAFAKKRFLSGSI
jgi:putative endonuclease